MDFSPVVGAFTFTSHPIPCRNRIRNSLNSSQPSKSPFGTLFYIPFMKILLSRHFNVRYVRTGLYSTCYREKRRANLRGPGRVPAIGVSVDLHLAQFRESFTIEIDNGALFVFCVSRTILKSTCKSLFHLSKITC